MHYTPSVLVITLPPPGGVYVFIHDLKGYPGQFFTLAIFIDLLILRRMRPEITRPFRAWVAAVYLRIGVSMALLTSPFVQPPKDGKGVLVWDLCSCGHGDLSFFKFVFWESFFDPPQYSYLPPHYYLSTYANS